MLTYLGLPISLDTEFANRHIQRTDEDTLSLYDVTRGQTLNEVNMYGNVAILGDYKPVSGSPNSATRTFPLLTISSNAIYNYNNVSNANVNIPSIITVPFWNPLRGDGKGFSIDLGLNPVKLKVFQDTNNATTSRFTISTSGINTTSTPPVTTTITREIIGIDTVGTSFLAATNVGTNGRLAQGVRILSNKNFTARDLGVYFHSITGDVQLAIYNSDGTFLGKTEVKSSLTAGSHLFRLENNVSIVSGTVYVVLVKTNNSFELKTTGNTSAERLTVDIPYPLSTANISYTPTSNSSTPSLWVENNWGTTTTPGSTETNIENNSFNIWANGMVSIGNTLSTATYANANAAGDAELNPNSLLVQNDVNIGTSGAKADSLARLHVKASLAEFNASRYLAFFASGDGVNAGAITKHGEYVCASAGRGFITLDEVNGTYYRIKIVNGAIQVVPFS